jgi:hypothetical protein
MTSHFKPALSESHNPSFSPPRSRKRPSKRPRREEQIMNQKRIAYIYQLTGTITSRIPTQASPKSKYANQEYYLLRVNLQSPNQAIKSLQVFSEKLTNPTIWAAVQQGKFGQQKYLFSCRNVRGYYYLLD